MKQLQKKLDHIKWLKTMGVDYYSSYGKDKNKDLFEEVSKRKAEISEIKQKQQIEEISNDQGRQDTKAASGKSVIPALKPLTKTATSKAKAKFDESQFQEASRALADKVTTLEELQNIVENFDGCDLKKFAKSTVFAQGDKNADILLIGEAPGATEDEQGIPFCGESGVLLDKMMESIL